MRFYSVTINEDGLPGIRKGVFFTVVVDSPMASDIAVLVLPDTFSTLGTQPEGVPLKAVARVMRSGATVSVIVPSGNQPINP